MSYFSRATLILCVLASPTTAVGGQRNSDPTPSGLLVFGFQEIAMTVNGPQGRRRIEGASGMLRLPVGEYQVEQAEAFARDHEGKRWWMALRFTWENSFFRVLADTRNSLRCGGPIHFSLRKRPDYGNVIAVMYDATQAHDVPDPDPRAIGFDLGLKDAFENTVSVIRMPSGKLPPPATLTISDSAGKSVKKCSFQYG